MDGSTVFGGTVRISSIDMEYTLADFPKMNTDYIVVGYIDASSMDAGDEIEIKAYVSVDGVNRRCLYKERYSNLGEEVAIYIKPFIVHKDGRALITIKQTSGLPKSFPYIIVGIPVYVDLLSLILKLLARQIA